jgi:hypothetical protein
MGKALLTVRWGFSAVLGIAMLYWARGLSLRYNAWTTRFRERNPHINPPPTPEWRERNTKIMTWIFRLFGTFLALLSILALIGIRNQTEDHQILLALAS